MSKYIIGGGIAGLIASFYNPDFCIISDNIGGQMAMNNAGPRILEVNEYSKEFLKDIGLKNVPVKIAKIGYKIDGSIVDNISKENKLAYYCKSRCIKNASIIPSSIMSDGKNIIEYFDVNWEEVIKILSLKSNSVIGKITDIDSDIHNIKSENKIYTYDKLISTIPAPIYFKLSNLEPIQALKYVKKIFAIIHKQYIDIGDYDYVYFPENKYKYHRITKHNDKAIIEYTTDFSLHSVSYQWNNYYAKYITIPIGQIQSGVVQNIKDTCFLGRYACWDHDIKTDDIVKICKEGLSFGKE